MTFLSSLFARSNRGIRALGRFTGIKEEKINEMVLEVRASDPERHRQFLLGLNGHSDDPDVLRSAATTFFIYRTFIRKRHPQDFRWWYDELRRRDAIPANIRLREIERASATLRNVGLGQDDIPEAQKFYQEMLAANE